MSLQFNVDCLLRLTAGTQFCLSQVVVCLLVAWQVLPGAMGLTRVSFASLSISS